MIRRNIPLHAAHTKTALSFTPATTGKLDQLRREGRPTRPTFLVVSNPHALAPGGTGKTPAAELIGKAIADSLGMGLIAVTSKYVGKTEKNLARLLDQAERTNSVLLFDEADALFGKRTGVKDSHDRYANQEASYLFGEAANRGIIGILIGLKQRPTGPETLRYRWIDIP